jgi:hypothetical protein
MSIGRTFEEAIQKAVRMVAPGQEGLEGEWSQVKNNNKLISQAQFVGSALSSFKAICSCSSWLVWWTDTRYHCLSSLDSPALGSLLPCSSH